MKNNFPFSISHFRNRERGFTLFVALVVMATLLLISSGMISLAVRHTRLANVEKDSLKAFYAADTGMECALYWDVKNPAGQSAFATSTGTTITCNQDASNSANQWVVGGTAVSTITQITFLPDLYCAKVTVTKNNDGTTVIESLGYNSCDSTNPRRVERAVRASY
jgi:Tfp pilus assembly protein PilX